MRFWSPGCGLVKISNGTLFESLRLTPPMGSQNARDFLRKSMRFWSPGCGLVKISNGTLFESLRVDPPSGSQNARISSGKA